MNNMKNLFFTVMALFATTSVFAQQGLEMTLNFTPGSSLYYNDEDFAAGKNLNFQATYALHAGLTAGYNFSDRIGIATGIGYASLNQNYITDYDNTDKSDQQRASRYQSYIRIPVLLRIGGDNMNGSSAFFRVGPHIDFLSSGTFVTKGSADNPVENTTNMRDQSILGEKQDILNETVFGVTAEIGGRIRLTDQMGLLILLHLETSLTNTEGANAGRYFESSGGSILNPERSSTGILMGGLTVGFQYVLSFD